MRDFGGGAILLHSIALGQNGGLRFTLTDVGAFGGISSHAYAMNAAAVLQITHPGVGPVTSLAFVLTLGPVERFERSKHVVSYLGLNPREHSSGGRQRRVCKAAAVPTLSGSPQRDCLRVSKR